MAYRIKPDESVPHAVRRIARAQLRKAVENLSGAGGDEAVHEARKSIKKTRALLRLVRPSLDGVYRKENSRLRDAGRTLSPLRDAGAMIGTLDTLQQHANGELSSREVAPVRRALLVQKQQLQQEVGHPEFLREVAAALEQTRRSARQWDLNAGGFPAIEPGLERTFRAGKEAFHRAWKTQTREDLHEWRKRVKDHWYQVRLLENLWCGVFQGYENSLKELESALGEGLNLTILRHRISVAAAGRQPVSVIDLLDRAIDASRKDLRGRAFEIGAKVYAEKPRELTRQFARLWRQWRKLA